MNWKNDDLAALEILETAIAEIFRKHPDITDYTAGRAYESAYQVYRALNRGHQSKPSELKGIDAEAFQAVRTACERLHTNGAEHVGKSRNSTPPVPFPKMVDYLRECSVPWSATRR